MKNIDNVLIGQTLQYYITLNKIKKSDLATQLNLSNANITHLIKGRTTLTVSRLIHLCEIFNTSPQKFFNQLNKQKLHVIY